MAYEIQRPDGGRQQIELQQLLHVGEEQTPPVWAAGAEAIRIGEGAVSTSGAHLLSKIVTGKKAMQEAQGFNGLQPSHTWYTLLAEVANNGGGGL